MEWTLEYRNARYINEDGWIDCEITHPTLGWIPYTLDPNDSDIVVDNNYLLQQMAINNDVEAYVPPPDDPNLSLTQDEIDALIKGV